MISKDKTHIEIRNEKSNRELFEITEEIGEAMEQARMENILRTEAVVEPTINNERNNFRPYDQNQDFFVSVSKKAFLEEKYPASIIDLVVERLDLTELYLPEKILRIDYVNENGVVRLSNEKKKYFDLLNLIAYNLRRDMVEIIGPVYGNNRDVHQLVLKILRLMTRIKYEGSDTCVVFTETLKGKENEALTELCRKAIAAEHRAAFFPGKLSFSVL